MSFSEGALVVTLCASSYVAGEVFGCSARRVMVSSTAARIGAQLIIWMRGMDRTLRILVVMYD